MRFADVAHLQSSGTWAHSQTQCWQEWPLPKGSRGGGRTWTTDHGLRAEKASKGPESSTCPETCQAAQLYLVI